MASLHDAAVVLDRRIENGASVGRVAAAAGWTPLAPDASLRTGILMLRSGGDRLSRVDPDVVREAVRQQGVSLTTYPGGLARLSMPPTTLTERHLDRVHTALQTVRRQFG
jgi:hypothetical protein